MHIADGVLPAWVSATGWVVTAPGVGLSLRHLPVEEIPKLALITSAVFLASLIHVPLGPTSVHLIFNGLAGLLLGPLAFLSFFVALTLQALLFQFGGLFSLGVNTLVMGGPAFLVGWISRRLPGSRRPLLAGFLGGGAILVSGVLLALALSLAGQGFISVAKLALVAHLPVALVEGIITGLVIFLLQRIRPEVLLVSLALLALPSVSWGHRLDADVYLTPQGLRVEAYFPDGTPGRNDRVTVYCQGKKVAEGRTDAQGVALLPRPKDCLQARIVVTGSLGHRAVRTLTLAPTSSPQPGPPPRAPKEPFPWKGVLSGLGFIFGLAGLILAWDTRRRLRSLASSRN
ncbi:MAG: cobalt transporter CbiM [Thermodesulfatator sp.]|nr:MAG: cobalt transporter CbiM [Thermodesulfatator sp.]